MLSLLVFLFVVYIACGLLSLLTIAMSWQISFKESLGWVFLWPRMWWTWTQEWRQSK